MSSSERRGREAADAFVVDDVFAASASAAPARATADVAPWLPAPLAARGAAAAVVPAPATADGDAFATLLEDFAAPAPRAGRAPAVRVGAPHSSHASHAALEAERWAREDAARDAAARAERERAAHERALAAAYAEGEAAGRAAAEAELQGAFGDALAALGAAADALRAHEERWLAHLEENVAALAVAVAQQVVAREVTADPALVVALARRALAEFPVDEPLTVRAHPDDLQALRAALDAPDVVGRRDLRWAPDARVARGGVLAEGRERIVDGRVDSALERMYRALARTHA